MGGLHLESQPCKACDRCAWSSCSSLPWPLKTASMVEIDALTSGGGGGHSSSPDNPNSPPPKIVQKSRNNIREGANREKLAVKKLISITRCFFTVCVPYKPWKTHRKPWKNRHPKSRHFFTVSFSPFSILMKYALKIIQESPRQTKPKKGPKRRVHEFRPFLCEFWCFFP